MKIKLSSTKAARNLGDCLARIKHAGDRFVLMKNNRPIAELGPVAGSRRTTVGDLWNAMKEASVDEDFAHDLERVNRSDRVLENPWPFPVSGSTYSNAGISITPHAGEKRCCRESSLCATRKLPDLCLRGPSFR